MSSSARSILTGLLQKDKTKRLGANGDGAEIKGHPFFHDVNWSELEKRKVKPPFVPTVVSTELAHVRGLAISRIKIESMPLSLPVEIGLGNGQLIHLSLIAERQDRFEQH